MRATVVLVLEGVHGLDRTVCMASLLAARLLEFMRLLGLEGEAAYYDVARLVALNSFSGCCCLDPLMGYGQIAAL